jgi:hypothetical protein
VSAEAAAFARDVITRTGPEGRDRAKNLLWAAGKLADYAMPLGLEAVPEVLLHPSAVERFTRCAPGPSPPQGTRHGTSLTASAAPPPRSRAPPRSASMPAHARHPPGTAKKGRLRRP